MTKKSNSEKLGSMRLRSRRKSVANLRARQAAKPKEKMIKGRDWPNAEGWSGCKAVCKRCHYAMVDIEPMSGSGEFWHPSIDKEKKPILCVNAGGMFHNWSSEVDPFLPKKRRRALKRMGIRP